MPAVDDVLKLIGLTTVIVVCLFLVLVIVSYAYGAIVGFTHGMQNNADGQDKLTSALNDYTYKLELVKEQTQRIDMYYAAKTSTSMSQVEFYSWLGTIRGLTDEFINRENNATAAGKMYLSYLTPGSDEYDRVLQNENTTKDDVKKVEETYDGNVYIYNQQFGDTYGDISYI